jgi:hypothetical protein
MGNHDCEDSLAQAYDITEEKIMTTTDKVLIFGQDL